MTSAQNHLLPLNGSRFILCCFLLLFLNSCTVKKGLVSDKNPQVVKAGTADPVLVKPKGIPENNPDKNNKTTPPNTNPPGDISVKVKVDTVKWKDVTAKYPPITITPKQEVQYLDNLVKKEKYHIKLLIPLNSDGQNVPADSRFVHFYAGALLALEELDAEGIKLDVKVTDVEEGAFKVSENADQLASEGTDMIIGPFDREDIRVLAEKCKMAQIPLVSPWQTSTKITNENPYYIQMKPNLKEHFLKLAENTTANYAKGEVAIIGKNNKETTSWVQYFQTCASQFTQQPEFFSTYFVTADSLNTGPTAFYRLFKNTKIKAVIIPNYAYTDEDFIYSCLRRLSAEKAGRNISVYGMPVMYDSEKIDFDYYHALQMKVVMSDFVDQDHGKIREFRRVFLDMYGEIPGIEAIKGYDLMLYLGRNLWKYGKHFQYYLPDEPASYLQSTYDIRKSRSEDSPIANDPDKFDYFENKHLDIIEFKNNKWERKN